MEDGIFKMISVREFGQYIVTKLIGEGGMGRVWRAWKIADGDFKKIVAIKTSKSPRNLELFMNEAKISARFEHENIVRTFDFGRTKDEFFIVMEYVRGLNLREFLSTVKTMPLDIFFYVMDKVLSAVAYIHDFDGRQLVHRDLNARNILVSWNGNIKVSDFGITLPQYGDLDPFGKLGYVPPEVILGKGWTQSGDIWCLGVLMWEMLTSRKLFSGRNKNEIGKRVLSSPINPPSLLNKEIHEDIDRIVLKALSRLPESRYASVKELQADLRKVSSTLGVKTVYQEDFLSYILEHFIERIRDEEKELAEEETRISLYLSEKSRISNANKVNGKEVISDEDERSVIFRKQDDKEKKIFRSDIAGGDISRSTKWKAESSKYFLETRHLHLRERSVSKKRKNKVETKRRIFLISSFVFGFILGLGGGLIKGSYDVRVAETLFKRGVIFAKENNFQQAKKMFEASANISELSEIRYISDVMDHLRGKNK